MLQQCISKFGINKLNLIYCNLVMTNPRRKTALVTRTHTYTHKPRTICQSQSYEPERRPKSVGSPLCKHSTSETFTFLTTPINLGSTGQAAGCQPQLCAYTHIFRHCSHGCSQGRGLVREKVCDTNKGEEEPIGRERSRGE